MSKRSQLVSILMVAALVACDACAQGRRGRTFVPVDLKHFTHEVVTFEAPSLESDEGEAGVYLPVDYDAEKRYPWVLWLHGMNEDASRFHDGGGAAVLDRMRGDGEIPELILVAPSGPRHTIYANGEQSGDVSDFILKDVVDYVTEHYSVADRRDQRAVMGVSMGGLGALRFALSEPDRFGTVAVHSAAAFPRDPTVLEGRAAERVQRSIQWLGLGPLLGDPIDPDKWATLIPSAIASRTEPDALHGLRIFFDAGTDDRYGFGPPNEEFHELLNERKIDHTFSLVEGGGHSWGSGSMDERLERSLEFVAAGFASEPPKDAESRDV